MGQFEKYPASDLGAITIAEALRRAKLEPENVDQVIIGHVSFMLNFINYIILPTKL